MTNNEKEASPSFLITTSHNPSHFLRRVSKLISYSLPTSKRINRGSLNLKELRNFCWNTGIQKVLIIQGSKSIDSVSICCYNFIESLQQMKADIILSNFNFPKRGDTNSRIEVTKINVKFSPEIPASIRRSVHNFMHPLVLEVGEDVSKSSLLIDFEGYSNGNILGVVTRADSIDKSPLYSFKLSNCLEAEP